MDRRSSNAGSFLLGLLVGILILVVIAYAMSSPEASPAQTGQPTPPPNQLQREQKNNGENGQPTVTVSPSFEAAWERFKADLAAVGQKINVNIFLPIRSWFNRRVQQAGNVFPTIVVTPAP